ncbi:hypothetical protein L3X38_014741 [Prunus dulcis]|uniref:KIB1-4 beta-propeller domain-containing protein n=1 Tax=Prunus dulcis TaxID=3755 RepID=A0AAD4WRE8_PRUDU|nr:hypothetical protein L3X38_014741 [Prunus dulcis]
MLMICDQKRDIWNLYDVAHNKLVNFQLRLPNKRYCGSSKGWLIVVDESFRVNLINPFYMVKGGERANSTIHLPPLHPPNIRREIFSKQCDYFVYKATISADPVLNANDCIVAVIYEDYCQLAFIRLNKDTKWTYADQSIDKRWRLIREVAFVEDKLYFINNNSRLFSFDITTLSFSNLSLVKPHFGPNNISVKGYLLDSNKKELLLVHKYYTKEGGRRVTKKFRVFGFSFNQCDWIEKSNLGDAAIFVGDNSSLYVLASKSFGCKPNCIYFNHDRDRFSVIGRDGVYDLGVYNLEDHSILQPYTTDVKALLRKARRPSMWVSPSFPL